MNSCISFDHDQARKFFLKPESYCKIQLPSYFEFESLLNRVSKEIAGKSLKTFTNGKSNPSDYENNNYTLFHNKDGKFAWRPLQIIHPALYVGLVHHITKEKNWNKIQERFKKFQNNPKIECWSLPLESTNHLSDKASTILNWLHQIEQRSIELALEFSSVLHTDITNCYGSIYTHSISWALHGKSESKENRKPNEDCDLFLGYQIDELLRNMQYGQSNGIPQGSVLMDFIAEIVLGYVDLELSEKLGDGKILNYKILRYRDDYRIFANSQHDLQIIAKELTEILLDVGMKLNEQKTLISNDIIKDSIKPDKFNYFTNINKSKDPQKHLLIIYKISLAYPNSGTLKKALQKFYDQIVGSKELLSSNNIVGLISILANIAYKNPDTYPILFANLSYLLTFLNNDEKLKILEAIQNKFDSIANTGYSDIWLQRVTIKTDSSVKYNEKLCKIVLESLGTKSSKEIIWNCDWLKGNLKTIIQKPNIVNKEKIDQMKSFISKEEVEVFSSREIY